MSNNIIKKTTEAANELLDSVHWMLRKFDAPGHKVDREKARGLTAEVSVAIKAGGTGEVTVILSKSYQAYPARAAKSDMEFKKGTKVRIVDVGSNMMYVEPADDSYGTTSGDLIEM
ncbi:MAG: NfeD family protein [Terriglobales bacterium]